MQQAVTIVDPILSRMRFDEGTGPLAESSTYAGMGLRVIVCEYPALIVGLYWRAAGREIRLHVQADNYDYLPPRGWWVGEDGSPLPARLVPSGGGFQRPPNPYGEDRGWLCFPGWREYHDHQSHLGDAWASRAALPECRLPGTLVQLARDLNRERVTAP